MLKLTRVLGNAADAQLGHRLHHLAHDHGAVEYVTLNPEDTSRRRMRLFTDRGTEVGLMLSRDEALVDGAVLLLEHDRAVVVRLSTPRWLGLIARDAAAALELGYFAGNMHWKVRFAGTVLWIQLEGDPAAYQARLAPLLADGRAVVIAQQAPGGEPPAAETGNGSAVS